MAVTRSSSTWCGVSVHRRHVGAAAGLGISKPTGQTGGLFSWPGRRNARQHRVELVTLLAPGQDAAYQEFLNRMCLNGFLKAIHRVDARFTPLGICGR